MRLRTDVGLAVGLALLACLAAAVLPTSLAALRAPLALPLVLFAPGYAIVVAALRPGDRSATELAMLAIATSIGTAIVSGVVLNAFRVRLLATPWMAVLTAVTVVAAVLATVRGNARPIGVPHLVLRRLDAAALALAVLLLGAAAALGFTPLNAPSRTQGATAMWLAPAPAPGAVCVGVISDQLHSASYTVTVSAAGAPSARFGPVTLPPGGSWARLVHVGPGTPVVDGTLRSTAHPRAVYRHTILRVWNIRAKRC